MLQILIPLITLVSARTSRFSHLAFEDNFEKLDFNKWRPEITAGGGGNWEFQFYNNDPRAAFVKNKILHLKPTLTQDYLKMSDTEFMTKGELNLWGNSPGMQCTANAFYGCERKSVDGNIVNPIMSAQLRTVNSFSFKYGRVEIEAKLPRGDWIWPAIWMMPKHHAYGGWPASGEIDIVESRGNANDCYGSGVNTVSSNLHWGNHWSASKYNLTGGKIRSKVDFSRKFTKFTLEWTKDYIRTMADNEIIMDVKFKKSFFKLGKYKRADFNPWKGGERNAPFDEEFYLILNVAVGGTGGFFPDNDKCKSPKKPWNNKGGKASKDFFEKKDQWYPTWTDKKDKNSNALRIKSVKVFTDPKPSHN